VMEHEKRLYERNHTQKEIAKPRTNMSSEIKQTEREGEDNIRVGFAKEKRRNNR